MDGPKKKPLPAHRPKIWSEESTEAGGDLLGSAPETERVRRVQQGNMKNNGRRKCDGTAGFCSHWDSLEPRGSHQKFHRSESFSLPDMGTCVCSNTGFK